MWQVANAFILQVLLPSGGEKEEPRGLSEKQKRKKI